ncbi:hypothetical protein BDP27DRAFT_588913 [Rhodocollybia butyracea]|uniref:Uncharacterized protein n=1 Tax=Rhodocollybia butyracea TaxID=206335 RepID=A0A9P5PY12_9AGAR|nr:hypothetical protein BDP27DRAFT_588913 [Rhodocollybia butyracea]
MWICSKKRKTCSKDIWTWRRVGSWLSRGNRWREESFSDLRLGGKFMDHGRCLWPLRRSLIVKTACEALYVFAACDVTVSSMNWRGPRVNIARCCTRIESGIWYELGSDVGEDGMAWQKLLTSWRFAEQRRCKGWEVSNYALWLAKQRSEVWYIFSMKACKRDVIYDSNLAVEEGNILVPALILTMLKGKERPLELSIRWMLARVEDY